DSRTAAPRHRARVSDSGTVGRPAGPSGATPGPPEGQGDVAGRVAPRLSGLRACKRGPRCHAQHPVWLERGRRTHGTGGAGSARRGPTLRLGRTAGPPTAARRGVAAHAPLARLPFRNQSAGRGLGAADGPVAEARCGPADRLWISAAG